MFKHAADKKHAALRFYYLAYCKMKLSLYWLCKCFDKDCSSLSVFYICVKKCFALSLFSLGVGVGQGYTLIPAY